VDYYSTSLRRIKELFGRNSVNNAWSNIDELGPFGGGIKIVIEGASFFFERTLRVDREGIIKCTRGKTYS
jgi:hypothetical protein